MDDLGVPPFQETLINPHFSKTTFLTGKTENSATTTENFTIENAARTR